MRACVICELRIYCFRILRVADLPAGYTPCPPFEENLKSIKFFENKSENGGLFKTVSAQFA